jgi:hypothetical protein
MVFIEYQPGVASPCTITPEEAYFILSGEVEGVLDGRNRRGRATSVDGCQCVRS